MDLVRIIEKAIEEEKAAQARYKEGAAQAENPEARVLFERLAKEEEMHEKHLKDMLTAIKLLKRD